MGKTIATLISIFLLLGGCMDIGPEYTSQNQVEEAKWYEGGSLHKANISHWKKATGENKLATCADFIASIDNTISMDELKVRAEDLQLCVDEAVKGLDAVNNESVASIASACIILLNQ